MARNCAALKVEAVFQNFATHTVLYGGQQYESNLMKTSGHLFGHVFKHGSFIAIKLPYEGKQ
jgi:hypothetical protein